MSGYKLRDGSAEIMDYTVGSILPCFECKLPLSRKDTDKALIQSLKENCEQAADIKLLREYLKFIAEETDSETLSISGANKAAKEALAATNPDKE